MAKKLMSFKTKGMNRDLSVSAFNPEFAFENMNLRISTNEGNTMLSWVNEKGTKEVTLRINMKPWSPRSAQLDFIPGTPIGTAVLNDKLVIFTTDCPEGSGKDGIFVLEGIEEGDIMRGYLVYNGNLNFSTAHPIETLVSYEADHIEKVYWTDGYNQPRMINISADKDKLELWNSGDGITVDSFFDFVGSIDFKQDPDPDNPEVDEVMDATVIKDPSGGGLFAPGVIQYCFTYLNKHGQQSNVVWCSAIEYLALESRAASPEEKVSCTFQITINKPNPNFEYVRIYSIQRTSLNAEPIVKVLRDVPITRHKKQATGGGVIWSSDVIQLTDTGTIGYSIDPMELLFVGGKEITALTMTDKDNVLFLGNITQQNIVVDAIQDVITEDIAGEQQVVLDLGFTNEDSEKRLTMNSTSGTYGFTNTLNGNMESITTFKGGETYRLGFQFQKKTGEWTAPIFLKDLKNDKYPCSSVFSTAVNLVDAQGTINLTKLRSELSLQTEQAKLDSFIKIRPVIVYPTISDRTVFCQGVLNPTVFNVKDRINNSPFAQASWFFRPYTAGSSSGGSNLPEEITRPPVEITVQENNPNTGVDPEFTQYVSTVYILRAEPKTGALDTILREKRLKTVLNLIGTVVYIPIIGVMKAPDSPLYSEEYFFVAGTQFPPQPSAPTEADGFIYEQFVSGTISIDNNDDHDNHYALYNSMYTDGGYLRYAGTPNLPSPYVFRFKAFNSSSQVTYYTATFYAQSTDGQVSVFNDNQGTDLRFVHYDSLPTQAENVSTTNPWEEKSGGDIRSVEIQGSINSYLNPYDTPGSQEARDKSNTQFMIDQSIVTLNSPDIEFDTEVQVFNTEGLKLRIVGAIPVTANISAHSIAIDSSMLETGNTYSKEIDTGVFGKRIITKTVDTEPTFGSGESSLNIIHKNADVYGGRRLVAEKLWNDVVVSSGANTTETVGDVHTRMYRVNYFIHPWQRSGSLNSDSRPTSMASSLLSTKRESHLLYSFNSEYFSNILAFDPENPLLMPDPFDIGSQIVLTENDEVMNYRLPRQRETGKNGNERIPATSEINYYANIDKILYNQLGYEPVRDGEGGADAAHPTATVYSPISMKYKSTSHAVIALKAPEHSWNIPILPSGEVGWYYTQQTELHDETFWHDQVDNSQISYDGYITKMFLYEEEEQDEIVKTHIPLNYLWIGELYKDNYDDSVRFGGNSKEALLANTWCVAGKSLPIGEISTDDLNPTTVTLKWTVGDTYYQRYDCLKTYPFTREDPNQLVEILSFMCETHVNIDGRYDRNRGQADNTNMSPRNFNLLNPVYSQRDNFFTNRIVDNDGQEELIYPNQITFTKTKNSGADVDLWTNITLASTLELDGDKGKISKLTKMNDQLIAFQDTGISQILYNERVQVSTEQGVPIELAKSGNVQGKSYISNTIGCSNKWSVCNTPSGIYFMDSHDKSIYLFNGKLSNLSTSLGLNSWVKDKIPAPEVEWTPGSFNNFVSYYDKLNQEVLFINKDIALAYSEKLGVFTSFYDYGNVPYFNNLNAAGIWAKPYTEIEEATIDGQTVEITNYYTGLWRHQGGEYGSFFGINKPYWMTLVGNPEPQTDKIFTNLEFRACVEGDGELTQEASLFTPTLPFDSLETWNEYQHGYTSLENKSGHALSIHGGDSSALIRKFRIWRNDIPRNNCQLGTPSAGTVWPYSTDAELGISRHIRKPVDRMRNPWLYLKLMKKAILTDAEVETINASITGTVKAGDVIPDTDPEQVYTRKTANEYNSQIPGAAMYEDNHKTETHDLVMTYFS